MPIERPPPDPSVDPRPPEAFGALGRAFLRDFISFAGRRRSAIVFGLMLAAAILEGVSLAFLVPLLALLQGDAALPAIPGVGDVLDGLNAISPVLRDLTMVGVLVVALAVRGAIGMLRDRRVAALQAEFTEHRRLQLIRAVANASWSRIAGLRHAQVTTGLTVDITRVASAAYLVMQITVAIIMLLVQLLVAFLLVPAIGFAALILIAVGSAIGIGRLRIAAAHGNLIGKQTHSLVDTAAQLLGGLKSAMAEDRQDRFVADFATATSALVAQSEAYTRRTSRFHFLLSLAIAMFGGALLLIGLQLQVDDALLIAALVTLVRMTGPVTALYRNGEGLAQVLPSYRAIIRLEFALAKEQASTADSADGLAGDIVLDDVTFSHGGGGVDGVSLRIAPGEIIGIVGSSGAGKTTLIDLIAGLLTPQRGKITVGGIDLDDHRLPGWRKRIAYAGQEAHLVNASIRANLAGPGVDDAMMWSALEQTAVADTVRAMPDGLDTHVAERGMRLSGGERQRIAIARAVLRSPALLILDEASNAVDIQTERRLLEALARIEPRPAMLVVAHRPETLANCSRIVQMEGGRLVDDRHV